MTRRRTGTLRRAQLVGGKLPVEIGAKCQNVVDGTADQQEVFGRCGKRRRAYPSSCYKIYQYDVSETGNTTTAGSGAAGVRSVQLDKIRYTPSVQLLERCQTSLFLMTSSRRHAAARAAASAVKPVAAVSVLSDCIMGCAERKCVQKMECCCYVRSFIEVLFRPFRP